MLRVRRRVPRARLRAAVALLAAACAASATACSSAGRDRVPTPSPAASLGRITAESGASSLTRIRASGHVRIGVKEDVPLFGLKDPVTGARSGFDIEIARIVTTALFPGEVDPDAHITFLQALSKDRERLLQRGEADLIVSTYTINDARKELVDFAGPYYVAGQDILATVDDVRTGRIRGIADLNGRRVCSVTGSTSLLNLRKAAPRADTSLTFDRYSDCYGALREGRVDALTTDDVILLGLAQADPGRFAITGNPFHTEPYGIGIAKGDTALREAVNDALAAAFADGRWLTAYQRTIGTTGAAAPKPPTLDR